MNTTKANVQLEMFDTDLMPEMEDMSGTEEVPGTEEV